MDFTIRFETALSGETGDNVLASEFQELTIEAEPLAMVLLFNTAPVKPRGRKRRRSIWVRNLLACGRAVEPGKASELVSAARRNLLSQGSFKIAEKQKWCFGPELFAHEEQRRKWRKQKDRCGGANSLRICNGGDTLSESTVSNLIMILQERHKRAGRKSDGGFATRLALSEQRCLTLIGKSADEATGQVIERPIGIIGIITVPLTCDQDV